MKNKGTLLFALVALIVAGYTYWDYRESEKSDQKKEAEEKFAAISEREISELSLSKGASRFVLKKIEGQWQMMEPWKDEGDLESIVAYVDLIGLEKGEVLKSGDVKWSDYFLAPPGGVLSVTKESGEKVEYQVSSQSAFDGSHYIRVGDKLILGSTGWARIVDKNPADLRNKKVYRVKGEMESIQINKKLTLVRQVGRWSVKSLAPEKTDMMKVQEFVDEVVNLRATEVTADEKLKPKKAVTTVEVRFVKSTPSVPDWRLEIGPTVEGAHYAVNSVASAIYKVSGVMADKFAVELNDFRNRKEPFMAPIADVKKIHIKAEGQDLEIVKNGENWSLGRGGDGKLREENVNKLVTTLTGLEAKEFVSGAGKGLIKPKGLVSLLNQEGKVVWELKWGESYTSTRGELKGQDMVFAKTSVLNEAIGLSANDIQQLGLKDLIEPQVSPGSGAKPEADGPASIKK